MGNGLLTATTSTPVSVSGIDNAIQIECGGGHTCADLRAGDVRCWGQGLYGQLGNGGTPSQQTTPVAVSVITNAVQVTAGGTLF